LVLIALLAVVVGWWRVQTDEEQVAESVANASKGVVRRVVDGDTLELADGRRVRLLGVDTPETKHPDRPVERGGPEATAWTTTRIEGRPVRLEFDRERRDRHGRWLAYVFDASDESSDGFVNEDLVRAGWSRADMRFPLRAEYARRLRAAEQAARATNRGLWSWSEPR
jgi:micrococcal nuclease